MKRRRFLGLGARSFALGWLASSGLARPSLAQPPLVQPTTDSDESDADASDAPGDGAAPLTRVPGLNAVEVRIGMTADFTGPAAEVSIDALRGALAWLNEINELGGIEGRWLNLLPLNDGGDPGRAALNARALVEDEEVFCLFNACGTASVAGLLPLIYGHREDELWLLGEISGAQAQRSQPLAPSILPVRASHRLEMEALVEAMRDVGASRFALFYPITAHGRSGADAAMHAIDRSEATLVAEATWRPDRSGRPGARFEDHLRTAARHLQGRGADALIIAGDGEIGVRLVKTAAAAGWRVPTGWGATVDSDGWYEALGELGPDGQASADTPLFTSRAMPFFEAANVDDGQSGDPGRPALEELRRLLTRWSPQPQPELTSVTVDPQRLSAATLEGFLHARLLTAGLRLAGPWPTRRGVRQAIESLRGYDLGIGERIDMQEPGRRGLARAFVGRWADGSWQPLEAAGASIALSTTAEGEGAGAEDEEPATDTESFEAGIENSAADTEGESSDSSA